MLSYDECFFSILFFRNVKPGIFNSASPMDSRVLTIVKTLNRLWANVKHVLTVVKNRLDRVRRAHHNNRHEQQKKKTDFRL